ncbi:MAG: hypothetical protein KDK30_14530 [Leptospiraceae bacterium]|nr:hypothetical protein [Leptospiraceae bacterium]
MVLLTMPSVREVGLAETLPQQVAGTNEDQSPVADVQDCPEMHASEECVAFDELLWQPEHSPDAERRRILRGWSLAYYRGQYTATDFGAVLLSADTDYKSSYIDVAALSKPVPYTFLGFPLEGEGQVVRHSGRQKHLEFNAVLIARWGDPFQGMPFSLGFGEGVSLATRNPDMENQRRTLLHANVHEEEDSRNFLNYLLVELEFGLGDFEAHRTRAFLRVHHRSGIYGLLCPPTCGSNFVSYGLRFGF